MINKVFIYSLSDPKDGLIKYVGKTSQKLNKRLFCHISESKKRNDKKSNWISSLSKQNLKPIIEILDEVPENQWEFWEKYWIAQLSAWGLNLKNGNEGGKGQSSIFMKNNNPMSKKENRQKISQSLKGNQYAKGFKHTNETKIKVSTSSTVKKKVKVTFLNSNNSQIFESVTKCADFLNIRQQTIPIVIRENRILKKLNCKFEFL